MNIPSALISRAWQKRPVTLNELRENRFESPEAFVLYENRRLDAIRRQSPMPVKVRGR